MSGHGPDADAFKAVGPWFSIIARRMPPHTSLAPQASSAALEPVYMKEALAFMFESTYIIRLTDWAMKKAGRGCERPARAEVLTRPTGPPGYELLEVLVGAPAHI